MKDRLLLCVLLVTGLGAGCAQDAKTQATAALSRGDAFFKSGKADQAIIEYRNAVQANPELGDAHLRLAEAYIASGQMRAAIPSYIRAADLLADDTELQIKAGNLMLNGGAFKEAQDRARVVLARDPKHVQALLLLGNSLAGLKNLEDAIGVLERVSEIDPKNTGAFTNLGVLRLAHEDVAGAETAFTRAMDISGGSSDAAVGLANFYRAVGRVADAEALLLQTLGRDPRNTAVNDALASFYVENSRPEEAGAYLRKLADANPDPSRRYILANHYLTVNRVADALAVLQELARNPAEYAKATGRIALVEQGRGNGSRARALIDEVLAAHPADAIAWTIKARLQMAVNEVRQARESVNEALRLRPNTPEAHLVMGQVHVAERDVASAKRSFGEALRLQPTSLPTLLALADIHIRSNEFDSARARATEAAQNYPWNLAAQLTLVRALTLRVDDYPEAKTLLARVIQAKPREAAAHALNGAILLKEGDLEQAGRAFDTALALNPALFEALAGLVSIDLAAKRYAEAGARVDAVVRQNPSSPEPLLLAADVYMASGDFAKQELALKQAITVSPEAPAAYGRLGQLYAVQNRLGDATRHFEELARLAPQSVAAPTMLGVLAYMQRDQAKAQKWWEAALTINPQAAAAANNLAWLYAETGQNMDRAVSIAEAAKVQLPDEVEVEDTLGWVYYKRGLAVKGLQHLEEATRKQPDNPNFQFHLGMAYAQLKEDSKARRALERALQIDPRFAGADDAKAALKTLVF